MAANQKAEANGNFIAGATGLSYALLVAVFPRAGGEAVFVNRGLGAIAGRAMKLAR